MRNLGSAVRIIILSLFVLVAALCWVTASVLVAVSILTMWAEGRGEISPDPDGGVSSVVAAGTKQVLISEKHGGGTPLKESNLLRYVTEGGP